LTGTVSAAQNLIVPAIEKVYIINNGLTYAITVKNTTGTGITVPAGKTMWVYNNGTNVVDVATHLTSLTLGSALPVASGGTGSNTGVNLASGSVVFGVLPNANTTASASNGASTIVARDASGNFTANTITANLTGLASNATYSVTAGNATNATTAVNATSATQLINSGSFNITVSGTKLLFSYNGATVASLDSTGNFTTLNNITAYGTP
jgi:hypothetical protein